MGIKTPEQFKESLRDGRVVYIGGEKVDDVTTHPQLKVAVETAATFVTIVTHGFSRTTVTIVEFGARKRQLLCPGTNTLQSHYGHAYFFFCSDFCAFFFKTCFFSFLAFFLPLVPTSMPPSL